MVKQIQRLFRTVKPWLQRMVSQVDMGGWDIFSADLREVKMDHLDSAKGIFFPFTKMAQKIFDPSVNQRVNWRSPKVGGWSCWVIPSGSLQGWPLGWPSSCWPGISTDINQDQVKIYQDEVSSIKYPNSTLICLTFLRVFPGLVLTC